MSENEIKKFFYTIYGENPPGYLTLWNRKNFRTKWLKATDLDEASKVAFNLSKDRDVYFGIGLRKNKLEENKRGTWEDILALPGLWLDIDIYDSKAHASKDLPKDIEIAENILNAFKLKPTILIHTGHGLNPLYLFEDLWIFKDRNDLLKAKALCFNFNRAIISIFEKSGYHMDNVGDLSRVIRVPYTTNFKTEPVPVKIIRQNLNARYTPEKIITEISQYQN